MERMYFEDQDKNDLAFNLHTTIIACLDDTFIREFERVLDKRLG
jgi:hypothetical protein